MTARYPFHHHSRARFGIHAYCEHNAGKALAFTPRETDVIEFERHAPAGIEVREHATLGDYLRELQREGA